MLVKPCIDIQRVLLLYVSLKSLSMGRCLAGICSLRCGRIISSALHTQGNAVGLSCIHNLRSIRCGMGMLISSCLAGGILNLLPSRCGRGMLNSQGSAVDLSCFRNLRSIRCCMGMLISSCLVGGSLNLLPSRFGSGAPPSAPRVHEPALINSECILAHYA